MITNNIFYLDIKDGFGNKIYRIIIGLYLHPWKFKMGQNPIKLC